MIKHWWRGFLWGLFIVLCNSAYAQVDREFWFAIPKETEAVGNLTQQNGVSFKITALGEEAHVVIDMPANPAFAKRYVTVAPYSSQIVQVADSWATFNTVFANTATGINPPVTSQTNRGIHITSDFDITVYYDYDMNENRDIFALKGRNGLDTEFLVPFQNIWRNANNGQYPKSLPFSSIIVVATEDATTVTITPPNIPGAVNPIFEGRPNNAQFPVTLNKGETYCLVSRGQNGIDHPVGTIITSDKKVAVVTNDDAVVNGGCEDVMGDELVGTSIIGADYVVMTGGTDREDIFVLGTVNGTTVSFYNRAGGLITTQILNRGQQYRLNVTGADPQSSIYVKATNNVYVWHTTALNCQLGAAILPPITNCTGSREVSFFVSNTINRLTVNLMIPRSSDPLMPPDAADQPFKFFRLKGSDGTDIPIPDIWFELNLASGWFVLKPGNRDFTGITKAGVTYTVYNPRDFFHFGFTNGHDQKANKYGYFSSFNVLNAKAYENSSETASKVACFGDTIVLRASGGMQYSWHYGSPTGPTTYISKPDAAITRVYPPPGIHIFYVNVANQKCFSSATLNITVIVLPRADADFTTDKTVGCAPLPINFNNTSKNANRFYWSYIENGVEYNMAPPGQSFTQTIDNNLAPFLPLNRVYKLIVSQDGACPDSAKKEITVYPEINAGFLPVNSSSCNPLTVMFQNLSSGNVTDTSYTWDFGDGGTSYLKNPVHIFRNDFIPRDTTYRVRLVTTSPYYCRDTIYGSATVRPFIKANYTVDTVRGCSPFTINIKNQSLGAITRSEWEFNNVKKTGIIGKDTVIVCPVNTGPDTVGYNLVQRVWNAAGCMDSIVRHFVVYPEYSVTFTASNNNICNAIPVTFTATPSNAATVTSYLWDFGDGSTSDLQNPQHIFTNNSNVDVTYQVRLRVTSKFNKCEAFFTQNILVHPFIQAQFATDLTSACAPYNVVITNKSLGYITRYTWDFGDGSARRTGISMLNGDTLRHYYDNTTAGNLTFPIKLVLETTGGCKDSITRNVELYPKVNAAFTVSQRTICNLGSVTFTPTPPLANNLFWSFGDGGTSAATTPTRVYSHFSNVPVKYVVRLTATSQFNCSATATDTVTVHSYIKAGFALNTNTVCSAQPFTITNNSGGGISTYTWDFGNGMNRQYPSGGQPTPWTPNLPPSIPYVNATAAPVTYKILLTVTGSIPGCTDTISRKITVNPEVRITGLATSPNRSDFCDSTIVGLSAAASSNATKFAWEFGDGNTGVTNTNTTTHLYRNMTNVDASYTIRVVAQNNYNCSGSFTRTINVHPFLEPRFAIDDAAFCAPNISTITNRSRGGITHYTWTFGDGLQTRTFTGNTIPGDTVRHLYDNTTTVDQTYKLKLQIAHSEDNINFCRASDSTIVTVYPKIRANFSDVLPGCNPLPVNFNNTSTVLPGNTFLWQFGDGISSVLPNPTHTYSHLSPSDVTFPVKLLAITQNNCKDSITKNVVVYSYVKAGFTTNVASGCSQPQLPVQISNSSAGGVDTLTWAFGDGVVRKYKMNAQPAVQTYIYTNNTSMPEPRRIFLTVQNNHLCKDTLSRTVTVYPRTVALFASSVQSGCNPLTVRFQNTSNTPVANTFRWEFGDGTSSDQASPQHVFTHLSPTDRIFNVKLLATSQYNCKDSVTRDITVFSYINANFTVDRSEGCSPLPVTIRNGSTGGVSQSSWSYGNGGDMNPAPMFVRTYLNTSNLDITQNIRLVVSNSHNCTDTMAQNVTVHPEVNAAFVTQNNIVEGCNKLTINFINQSGPFPVPVEYRWDFGDKTSSNAQFPSHTFENLGSVDSVYTTKLYAISRYKCIDSAELDIKVYPFIKANFTIDKSSGCSPVTVDLVNSSSPGSNRFYWNFDDGSFGSSGIGRFSHVFRSERPDPLVFRPRLVVAYNNGTTDMCFDTITRTITAFPVVVARYSEDRLNGCQPLAVSLFNTSTLGLGATSRQALPNELNYTWLFGDASSSNLPNPQHTFWNFSNTVDSIYSVSLLATSIYNCSSSTTKNIIVYPKPKAAFATDQSISCPPFPVNIINQTVGGTTFKWWFGDSNQPFPLSPDTTTLALQTVPHTYDNLGSSTATYEIRLLAETAHGCLNSTAQAVKVFPHVIADFVPDTAGCSPFLVQFTNRTQQANTYVWDFGDNTTSLLVNPSHNYFNNTPNDVDYSVLLRAYSEFGCSDSISRNVRVYPSPVAEFNAEPTHLYYPQSTTTLTNNTNPGPWQFFWNFGDGNTFTQRDPGSHQYLQWGGYDIKMDAWSDHCRSSVTRRIRIFPPVPIVDFAQTENGCEPLIVRFTDRSTWATSWYWEFDDGAVSTEQHPSHLFERPGKYQVKLTIRGDGGEVYKYSEVEVYPKPEVNFTYAPELVMLPKAEVKFYNTSKLGISYLWEFGDSAKSAEISPLHTYSELGKYNIKLGAWTEHGCYHYKYIPNALEVVGTGIMRFPNAFRPNSDGPGDGSFTLPDTKNEVFHPYSAGVVQYHLEIYDRWGEKLFETDDINVGWNGYYKQKLCKADVYIWRATGKYTNGKTFDVAGDVTLLR